MNDEGALSFATAIDTSGYEKGIERLRGATESMGNVVSQSLGSAATLSEKYAELTKVCDGYERAMQALAAEVGQYQEQARQAFASGDIKAFDDAVGSMRVLQQQMAETAQEAQGYSDALSFVGQQMGIVAQAPTPPMFFTQEQLEVLDGLNSKLASLNQQLLETPGDDAAYASLKAQIADVNAHIDTMEMSAAKAAARLGSDLGGRASEASSRLHELSAMVKEQEEACKRIEAQAQDAGAALQNLQNASADASAIASAQTVYDGYAKALQNAQLQLVALQGAQNDAKDALSRVTAEAQAHNSVIVKMLGGHEKYTQVLSNLPGPLQSAITGITGMTGAAKAFIATPLGAIIAAIVLALQAMSQWFNSSVEGQLKFAEISGYVSGVLGQLKEIVISVGKALYDAFTNPKEAGKKLLYFIRDQILVRIKSLAVVFGSLGDVIADVFTGKFTEAKEALKSLGEASADFLTGIDGTVEKVSKWGASVSEAAEATAKISRATKELQMEASRWQQKETEYGTQMTELYTKMMDNSLSKAQRKKYQKDYEDLVNLVSDKKVELAQKAVDLQSQKMSLTTNSIEDEMELDTLNNNLAQAKGYKSERLRMLQRMSNRLDKADTDPQNAMDKADETAERQMKRALQEVEYRVAQAEIDAKEEGEEKVLAQMRLNHQKELDEIDRQKEDYLQKRIETERAKFNADKSNKGKHFDSSSITLTKEEESMFDSQREDTLKKQAKENEEIKRQQQEAMSEYLAQWGDYAEKRQAIIDLANAKMAKATTEGEKKGIAAQMQKDLGDLDIEQLKKSLNWEEVFKDLDKVATPALEAIKKKLKQFIETNKQLKPEAIKELLEAIEKMDANTKARSPFKTLSTSLKNLKEKIQDAKTAQDAYNKAVNEGTEAEKKNAEETRNAALSAKQKALVEATEALKAASAEAGEVAATLESIVGCFADLGIEVPEQIAGFVSGIGSAVDALGTIDLTRPMSIITGFVGAIGGIGKAIGSLFNNDSGHEKRIERLQGKIDALEKSYSELEKSIESAYSTDASKLIEQGNTLLEQKKALIQQQINEEKTKKNTDDDRIKQWEEEIESLNEAIEDNKQKAMDAIFGEDLKSAIENFASAYADAWASGEDRAKSAKDTVRDMMKKMVQASIKAAIQSSDAMERIRQKLREFYEDDGILSDWEQNYVMNMAQALQEELDEQFGWADSLLNDSKYEQSATGGGFETMSEDTGTELNGRFTAMQISMDEARGFAEGIKADTGAINSSLSLMKVGMDELQNIALLQLGHLEAISRNTKELGEMKEALSRIDKNIQNM